MRTKFVSFVVILSSFSFSQARKQTANTASTELTHEDAFFKAELLVNNLNTFESEDSIEDETNGTHHLTESRAISSPNLYHQPFFICLADDNGQPSDRCHTEWGSDSLHALTLMENLRAGVVWLRQSDKWRNMWLDSTKSMWSDMRDIYCENHPKWLYKDLDGAPRACSGSLHR